MHPGPKRQRPTDGAVQNLPTQNPDFQRQRKTFSEMRIDGSTLDPRRGHRYQGPLVGLFILATDHRHHRAQGDNMTNAANNNADPNNDNTPPHKDPIPTVGQGFKMPEGWRDDAARFAKPYTARVLDQLTEFLISNPGVEIRIVHRGQLQAIAIDAEIVTAGDRHHTQQLVSDRAIVDSRAPGHPLAKGIENVIDYLTRHLERKTKDAKP